MTLLQAYLSRAAPEVVARGYLTPVLGVFQKLIASKAHDHDGFAILDTLIATQDLGVMGQVGAAGEGRGVVGAPGTGPRV